jgi:hypothetical protein
MTVIRAAMVYFALVFAAGFIMGTIRTLMIAPRFGEMAALAVELPVMLAISWWACGWVLKRMPIAWELPPRIAMGLLAFALLLAGEAAISVGLGGLTLAQHAAIYLSLPVQVGLVAQMLFAAFPALRHRG